MAGAGVKEVLTIYDHFSQENFSARFLSCSSEAFQRKGVLAFTRGLPRVGEAYIVIYNISALPETT